MANEKTIAKKQAQVDELAKVLKDAKVVHYKESIRCKRRISIR